jgi:sortase (surface protein transpeptidase)
MSDTGINFNTIQDPNKDPLETKQSGMSPGRKRKIGRLLNVYIIFGFLLIVVANLIIASPILLPFVYEFYPDAHANEVNSLTDGLDEDRVYFADLMEQQEEEDPPPEEPEPVDDRPPFDATLPATNSVLIPKVGVNATLVGGPDYNAALDQGAWIVNDFGTPENPFAPIIIASHRFGGVGWTQQKRDQMSFYRLPETQVGDQFEIVWGQRKYVYEIYKAEENTEITDYEADLILYTCKVLWESPDRIFRYANRVN